MAIKNPIKYTSRTFSSILSDINADASLVDKPIWWKRIWAGIGDVLSVWLNSMVNLVFLRTAYTRQAVSDLCELIDYYLSPQTTSTGTLMFFVNKDLGIGIFPFTVPATALVARSSGGLNSSSKVFSARTPVTMLASNYNCTFVNTGIYAPLYKIQVNTDPSFKLNGMPFTLTGSVPAELQQDTIYYMWRDTTDPFNRSFYPCLTMADALAGIIIPVTSGVGSPPKINFFGFIVQAYQEENIGTPISIGVSDGISPWQEFSLPDLFAVLNTLNITINGIAWTRVTTFVNSTPIDKHYKVIPLSNGKMNIRFGDGTYGLIPPAFDILAVYSFGGGKNSNVNTIGEISNYNGGSPLLNGAYNITTFNGGSDEETIENAKKLAPILLKARGKFIEVEDGEALALQYGGLSSVKIWKNYYGALTCRMFGIATGGGQPSLALRTDIANYLMKLTVLDSVLVVFDVATLIPINVVATVKVKDGYSFIGGVDKFVSLAFKLLTSENGKEIQQRYLINGIAEAVSFMNSVFGTTFTEDDYPQLATMLGNFTPCTFGFTFRYSDIYGFIDTYVDGVDYINILSFGNSVLPYSVEPYEISTVGSITLTEITV